MRTIIISGIALALLTIILAAVGGRLPASDLKTLLGVGALGSGLMLLAPSIFLSRSTAASGVVAGAVGAVVGLSFWAYAIPEHGPLAGALLTVAGAAVALLRWYIYVVLRPSLEGR